MPDIWGLVTTCKQCDAAIQWHRGAWSPAGAYFDADGGKHCYTCTAQRAATDAAIERIWAPAYLSERMAAVPAPLRERHIPADIPPLFEAIKL